MPKGTTLEETVKVSGPAADSLKKLPEMKDIYQEDYKDRAVLHMLLKGKKEQKRPREAVMQDINDRLKSLQDIERVEVGFGSGANSTPVELEVSGKEMETIRNGHGCYGPLPGTVDAAPGPIAPGNGPVGIRRPGAPG
ncbi:hypothetical protein DCCM_3011 [Desulfocucumis palustris]|uniref:Uncharacterized protein n=2 Tax=Desulfocucumis palustris TaxID=1898651 RepID=A0A2L2XCN0_9FIRM|nr:hypothetical protein DCCM_3011 [Desulfocucumis palustris]